MNSIKYLFLILTLIAVMVVAPEVQADEHEHSVTLNLISRTGIKTEIGQVILKDTEYGLLLSPELSNLTPGIHGFHIHANPSCEPGEKDGATFAGLAAGGHYDPEETGKHEGPYGEGHLGDLPPLYVDAEGNAAVPMLAPRLTVADVQNRSLMVHLQGDNFSDTPSPLGGGGPRIACGVIQ